MNIGTYSWNLNFLDHFIEDLDIIKVKEFWAEKFEIIVYSTTRMSTLVQKMQDKTNTIDQAEINNLSDI